MIVLTILLQCFPLHCSIFAESLTNTNQYLSKELVSTQKDLTLALKTQVDDNKLTAKDWKEVYLSSVADNKIKSKESDTFYQSLITNMTVGLFILYKMTVHQAQY